MVSFLNTTHTVGGRPVVLCSMGSSAKGRANGVLRVGVIGDGNRIDWISELPMNDGFFAYSCLTELSDGRIALLFEDEAAHFCYRVYGLSDDGTLSPADGGEQIEAPAPTFADRLLRVFAKFMAAISR